MTFIVHMETMVDGMAFQVRNKACNVNNCHAVTLPLPCGRTHFCT
jgi:hypothetical protein